jgi:ABC-type Fe3+ transport system substrate-binding protein
MLTRSRTSEGSVTRLSSTSDARPTNVCPADALLFYEYLLGEGQQYFVNMDYVPTNMKVASPLTGVKIVQANPSRSLDEADKWSTLFENTVVKRSRR